MKTLLKINLVDNIWTAHIDNRLLSWVFHKLFKLEVNTVNKRGLNGILDDLKPALQKGRVIKATTSPGYDPDQPATGGRIVRTIPKQLKKIKEGQEQPLES